MFVLFTTASKLSESPPYLQNIMRPTTVTEANSNNSISSHILPTSANLVGVCIMSLSLVKLLPRHGWSTWVDEMLALDSMVFLVSVALSYASLRIKRHSPTLENWAELFFLGGLVLIILASLVLTYGIG
jgi:hypothetical protein